MPTVSRMFIFIRANFVVKLFLSIVFRAALFYSVEYYKNDLTFMSKAYYNLYRTGWQLVAKFVSETHRSYLTLLFSMLK